ncbi:MAG: hypothetical protein ABI867_11085 [Kofleriaceae bacterium]
MVGSRDAFLFGVYPSNAIATAAAHAAVDEALAASPDDRALGASAASAKAMLGRTHEMSGARAALISRAADNHVTLPEFQPTDAWLAQVRDALEDLSKHRTLPYELGKLAGDVSRTLFVLRTLATMRAASPTGAALRQQIASLLKELERDVDRMRTLGPPAASEALRILDALPDFLNATSPDGFHTWIGACLSALGQLGQSFTNELPVATAAPTEAEVELHQSILREPARDDLREMYAVLARRRDDPRARLIELQLTTRDLRRKGISLRYGDLMREASKLIAANPEWTDTVVAKGVAAAMHRGFVEEIHGDLTTILARIDELVAIAPILHINVAGAAGRGAELAACSALAQVQSLSFEKNGITDADLAALAASQYVENLRWLDLGWNKITDAGVDALAGGRAKALVCVLLGSNPCADPIDEQIYFDDTHYGWEPSPRGVALEATHGALPWLHPSVPVWPPYMGVV